MLKNFYQTVFHNLDNDMRGNCPFFYRSFYLDFCFIKFISETAFVVLEGFFNCRLVPENEMAECHGTGRIILMFCYEFLKPF